MIFSLRQNIDSLLWQPPELPHPNSPIQMLLFLNMTERSNEAVIFDLGGVFVWDVWEHMYFDENGLVEKYNLPKEKAREVGGAIYRKYGYNIAYKDTDWHTTEVEYWNDFISAFREELPSNVTTEDFIETTDQFVHAIDEIGMHTLFRQLKEGGAKMAICSNQTNFWFERANAKFHFEKYFPAENVFLSYKLGQSKSDGFSMFEKAVHSLQTPKEQCIFFDDRQNNITLAKKYGIKGILLPRDAKENVATITQALQENGG